MSQVVDILATTVVTFTPRCHQRQKTTSL